MRELGGQSQARVKSGLWFVVALAGPALVALGLRQVERAVLFPAPPVPRESPMPGDGARHTWLDTPGGRVEAFLLPGRIAEGRTRQPLVIYAHGNGELIDSWLGQFDPLRAQGLSVLLVEYPGYGRSSGSPSRSSIQQVFAAAYDWALTEPEVDPRRIVGYGRSLGGGAVCALGRVRPLAALVLESTFTSIRDVATDAFGVPGFVVWNEFDNLEFVRGYESPVLVLHGEQDRSIPVAHARRIAATAPAAEIEILQCGHNDCPRPWARIVAFLAEHGI